MKWSAKEKAYLEEVLKTIPGYNPWDLAGDAWLDHDAAAAAINFFADRLHHIEGATRGQPFELRRWQAAIVGNIFGWKRRDTEGRIVRRYRRVALWVARGNGKTPLAAGIVLCGLFTDLEPGAQNFLAAGAREQAGFLFRNAKGMIEQDPDLDSQVRIYGGDAIGGARSIILRDDPLTNVKVIPADAASQHGGIPHITVIDELHVQKSRDLIDVFETAMAKKARTQPLMVMITTADYDRISICNETFDYACKVRDNGGDPAKPGYDSEFLPVLYVADDDDDWTDEEVWKKANPNLGVSVELESLRKSCRKAQENPGFENEFRRLHVNQKTSKNVRIVPMKAWDECPGNFELKPEDLLGRQCYGGLDLASTEDLAALALVFPLEEERIAILIHAFCPEEKVKIRARQRTPYDVWKRQGYLTATAGDQIDYTVIEETIDQLRDQYEILELGADPYNATHLLQRVQEKHGEDFVVSVRQTMLDMSGPFKHFLRLIKLGRVCHFKNPLLRWTASNVAGHFHGKLPKGAKLEEHLDKVPVMPSKQSSADKIDPFVATTIAIARMIKGPEPDESDSPIVAVI